MDLTHFHTAGGAPLDLKAVRIAPGAVDALGDLLAEVGLGGKNGAFVFDSNTVDVFPARAAAGRVVVLPTGGLHGDDRAIALLEEALPPCEFIVGVGAGTVTDLCRHAAFRRGIPFVSVPTACSVDGFASHSCSLTLRGMKTTVPTRMPLAICADTDILRRAPLYLALSGFGDMMGKYIALADWQLAALLAGEPYDEDIAAMQREAVSITRQTAPLLAGQDEQSHHALIRGLILSGIAMQLAGVSRPAAGAEHYLSHFWEMEGLGVPATALHGERVGAATLMVLRRYRQIAAEGPAFFAAYPRPMESEDAIRRRFGKRGEIMCAENRADSIAGVSRRRIGESWPRIAAILAALPDADELDTLYRRLGAKRTMRDLDLPDAVEESLYWSPYARNKLTLLRIAGRC